MNTSHRTAVAGALAACALLLAGCTAGPQSEADACLLIQSTIAETQQDLVDGVSSFAEDPTAGAAALRALADDFADATEKIDNAQVKPQAETTRDALSAFADEVEQVAKSPDPSTDDNESLAAAFDTVDSAFAGLANVCPD